MPVTAKINPRQEEEELRTIRRILLDPAFREHATQIDSAIKTSTSAVAIGSQLKEAFEHCEKNKVDLSPSLFPFIEKSIHQSIEANQSRMVDILYPILGSLVQKSVVEAIKSFVDSLNAIIERSFSLQGWRWRTESWRTGIPIAQIAMKHVFVYNIEHIFLIHKRSARLLCSCSSEVAIDTDKTTFSGMIEVVTNFIRDVFWKNESVWLEELDLGELKICLEESEDAILAYVVRGQAPSHVRTNMRDILRKIQFVNHKALAGNNPVEKDFLNCYEFFQPALVYEKKNQEDKNSFAIYSVKFFLIVALVSFVLFGALLLVQRHQEEIKYSNFINALRDRSGLLVTFVGVDKDHQKIIQGISIDPQKVYADVERLKKKFDLQDDSMIVDLRNPSLLSQFEDEKNLAELLRQYENLRNLNLLDTKNRIVPGVLEKMVIFLSRGYFLSKKIKHPFIVVLNCPFSLTKSAENVYIHLLLLLRKKGIFDYHLVQINIDDRFNSLHVQIKEEKAAAE